MDPFFPVMESRHDWKFFFGLPLIAPALIAMRLQPIISLGPGKRLFKYIPTTVSFPSSHAGCVEPY